ncbi:MAG: hypothetical protein AABY18_01900 [Candidatus Thermoplasmatota archaeon]
MPAGAACIDQTVGWADSDNGARLWRADDGHVWVEVKVHRVEAVTLGVVTASSGGVSKTVVARGLDGGFVDVGVLGEDDSIEWEAEFYQMQGVGSGRLAQADFAPHLTAFRGDAWVVVGMTLGPEAYWFNPMGATVAGDQVWYAPVNLVGPSVNITVEKGVSAAGDSVVPASPLLDLSPTGPCD